jgi:RNA 3'-terminal phosphate cyclase
VTPEGGDLLLVDSVEPELVSQSIGNADKPAETVGQRAVEVEYDQLESQGTLSVGGWEV